MKRSLIFVVLMFVLVITATAATTKKYLNLGADPQAKDRQPGINEEVVIIDTDICDSGWGNGSGTKIAGCYPKNSAVIRDKTTGFVTAMFRCGNEPSDKRTVTGKVVIISAPIPISTSTPASTEKHDAKDLFLFPSVTGRCQFRGCFDYERKPSVVVVVIQPRPVIIVPYFVGYGAGFAPSSYGNGGGQPGYPGGGRQQGGQRGGSYGNRGGQNNSGPNGVGQRGGYPRGGNPPRGVPPGGHTNPMGNPGGGRTTGAR